MLRVMLVNKERDGVGGGTHGWAYCSDSEIGSEAAKNDCRKRSSVSAAAASDAGLGVAGVADVAGRRRRCWRNSQRRRSSLRARSGAIL